MVSRDDVQRYLDAGIAFTAVTRARAEELVGELVSSGAFPSAEARAKVDELIERSRKSREALVAQVRDEVASQLGSLGITSLEDLAREVTTLINRTAEAGRTAADKGAATKESSTGTGKTAGATSPAKKSAAKSPAKPSVAKSPAKKSAAAATKSRAKATAATAKGPAKKATKKSPAKTSAAATQASVKKSTGKKGAAKKPAAQTAPGSAAPVETTPSGTDG